LSFYDPSDLLANNLEGKLKHLVLSIDTVQYANINHTVLTNTDPHYSKALPSKINYEKLSPHLAFRPHEIIYHTLRKTTKLVNSVIHHSMQHHLKIQFQMLRHKRLNEVIATDTYFSSEKSIERYCEQVFFGITSKILHAAGMKTESDFSNVYLYKEKIRTL
jgi:hypothetical protein